MVHGVPCSGHRAVKRVREREPLTRLTHDIVGLGACGMKVIYVPWSRALELCYRLASKILDSGAAFDVVVAIARGGLVPAMVVSDVIGAEEMVVVRSRYWGVGERVLKEPEVQAPTNMSLKGLRVLVVDDVVDTGATLSKVVRVVQAAGASEVRTAALHLKPTASAAPDYHAERLSEWAWVYYPWSLMETLYALATKRGGDLVESATAVLKEVNAVELYLDPSRLIESVQRYAHMRRRRNSPPQTLT